MSGSTEHISNPFLHSRSEDVSGDDLWKRYLDVVGDEDKASIERWQGSTSGLLTFTGIFAATVATFLTQSFEQLQPDTAAQAVFVGNQTVHLLALLVSANNPTLAVPSPDISSNPFDFQVPTSAIILNSLWFLSLVISLVCTLLATLVQEWSRNFQRACQRRSSDKTVKEAAFNHIYQRMGVDRYGLDYMTSVIVGLIHVAVVLFLVGLVIFLAPVHQVPALVVIISSAIAAAFYIVASAIPVFSHDCPYQTWLTPVFGCLGWAMYTMIFTPILVGNWARERRPKDGRRLDSSIILALIKGVRKYTYELFDPDVDYVYLNDLPHDLKTDSLITTWLRGRSTDWKNFLNGSRLAFVWERMSGYLLLDSKDNGTVGALLGHLPRQIPGGDIKSVSAFIVRLRRRERFMKPLAHMMREVNSVATAVGALQLLQMLVSADSPDAPMYDFLGGHGKIIEDTIAKHFPSIVAQMDTVHKDALRDGDLSVLIEVTKLRWALLNKRDKILRKAQEAGDDDERRTPPNDEEIGPLHAMLLCLEKTQGLRLLPLPLSDCCGHERSELQDAHADNGIATVTEQPARHCSWRMDLADGLGRFDLTFGRDVAGRNALTLLAYLVWFAVQAKGSGGPLPHASIGACANLGFDGPKRKRCRLGLGGWKKHLKATEPMPGAHVQPASFPRASAVLAYLCDEAIDLLHLTARLDPAGRVTEFVAASQKEDGDEDSGSCKAIRALLNELVKRVSYHPSRSPSTSTALGQTTSSATKEDPEGLKMLKECGIFGTQMQQPAKIENLSLHGVGCDAGGAEEQIMEQKGKATTS